MVSPMDQLQCNRLVFEAINENSLSKLQLAKTTYNPILLMESLAQCNQEGKTTPIIVAMERGNDSVIEELITWMLDYKNHSFHEKECKSMPIFIIDQFFLRVPVLHSEDLYSEQYGHISHGINKSVFSGDRKSWLELIGFVFLKSTSLTRQDKIIALELIGALAIIYCCDAMSQHALKYWREAMTLRYFPQDGEPLLPKVPANCVPTRASSIIFGSAAEIMTMEELKLLEEDSTSPFKEQLLIQALLVMRRIFTQANLEHPHWLYLESFLEYAVFLNRRVEKIEFKNFSTYIFIFEQLNGYDPKLLSRRSFDVFTSTIFRSFCFLRYYNLRPGGSLRRLSDHLAGVVLGYFTKDTFNNLLALAEFITKFSEFFPNPAMISSDRFFLEGDHFAEIVYRFLSILESISSRITNQEKHQLEEYFSYFINFFPERTITVLHKAAKEAHKTIDRRCIYRDRDKDELLKTFHLERIHTRIKLILHLEADVNAIDEEGRTPLHLLAPMQGNHLEIMNIFQTLVDAGSHLYLADDYGETVMSILRGNVERNQNDEELPSQHYFESLVNDVFPLTCLCARVIRRHRIPFQRLPLTLQKLVSP